MEINLKIMYCILQYVVAMGYLYFSAKTLLKSFIFHREEKREVTKNNKILKMVFGQSNNIDQKAETVLQTPMHYL